MLIEALIIILADASQEQGSAIGMELTLQNLNRSEEFTLQSLIRCDPAASEFQSTMAALINFFPAALCKLERPNFLQVQSPTTQMDAKSAFYNFRHRVLDTEALSNETMAFVIHLFRPSGAEVEAYLLPPHHLPQPSHRTRTGP